MVTVIATFEVSYEPTAAPALVMHHLIQGYDTVRMDAATAAELGALLTIQQKRIRELGGYRALFGASGDLALYAPNGQRACYLNADQTAQLARVLA